MGNDNAKGIAQILRGNYESLRYDNRFTVWGVAYWWDQAQENFRDHPQVSSLAEPIEIIIDAAKKQGEITQPPDHVPKSQNRIAHYVLLCLGNREVVHRGFYQLSNDASVGIEDIVDDSRITGEAAQNYVDAMAAKTFSPNTTFAEFLLMYPNNNPDTKTPGKYAPLLERLARRFQGQSIVGSIENLVSPPLYDLLKTVEANVRAYPTVTATTLAAFSSIVGDPQSTEITKAVTPLSLSKILGRRRRKRTFAPGTMVDWESFMAEHARERGIDALLSPEAVMQARITDTLRLKYFEIYRRDPAQAWEQAKIALVHETNSEIRKALNTTLELLQYMDGFDQDITIHHSLKISRRQ